MEDASASDILEELIRSIVTEGAHKPVVFIDNIENILSVEDIFRYGFMIKYEKMLTDSASVPV